MAQCLLFRNKPWALDYHRGCSGSCGLHTKTREIAVFRSDEVLRAYPLDHPSDKEQQGLVNDKPLPLN
jgi:hypothetical protein